jgi:hypothetical protein
MPQKELLSTFVFLVYFTDEKYYVDENLHIQPTHLSVNFIKLFQIFLRIQNAVFLFIFKFSLEVRRNYDYSSYHRLSEPTKRCTRVVRREKKNVNA